jgi:predicted ATPase
MSDAEILERLGGIPGNEIVLPLLVEQLRTPIGVVPFVGAGMSVSFGFPDWTTFLRGAARLGRVTLEVNAHIAAGRYEEAAEALVSALTPGAFQDLLESRFGDQVLKGKALSGTVSQIPALSNGPVITTNFDRLLERVFRQQGCSFETVVSHSTLSLAIPALEKNEATLLKVHGDWSDPENRVLTLSEYNKHYGGGAHSEAPLPMLLNLLAVRPVLFLGCSLVQDRTVMALGTVATRLRTSRHYAVVQRPRNVMKFRARARFLADHNIRPIWYPEREHHRIEPLLTYLADQVPEAFRRRLPARVVSGPKVGRLPVLPTRFIGRERDLAKLSALASKHSLVTIAGGPGAGKTRLSIELARTISHQFEALWFVELSQLQEASLVPQRVATVLGIREQVNRTLTESIGEFLAKGRNLVVLDNCDHLRVACAGLVERVRLRCSDLTIVVTSREVLRLDGEQVYYLPPLDLPDPKRLPALDALARVDSIELFLARAGDRLTLKPQNARAVATLCLELEGIPLAIELAAGQLSALSVSQLLQHIDHRLKVLVGGPDSTEERHWRTLHEAIEFSHDRLAAEERRLFRRLTVFSRGFTWDAATAVCSDDGEDQFEILRRLNELLARSLLVVVESNREEKRYRMLDSIREFGADALDATDERIALDGKHAAWFASLAERAAPELLRKEQGRWLDVLTEDAENLRGAILWSVRAGQAKTALRLGASLWRFADIRGLLREGRERLEMVLAMPGTEAYVELRSRVLSGAGMLAYRQSDIVVAAAHFTESLKLARKLNDRSAIANGLNDLGIVARTCGDYEGAWRYHNEGLQIEHETENERGISVALFNLGRSAEGLGKFDDARRMFELSGRAFAHAGNVREEAFALQALGEVTMRQGHYNEALELLGRSLKLRQDLLDKKGIADTLRAIGAVDLKRRDIDASVAHLRESFELAQGLEDKSGVARTLEQFATVAFVRHNVELMTTLYAAAQKLRDENLLVLAPIDRAERDRRLEEARASMGGDQWRQCEQAGQETSLGDLIEMAAQE